jgi:hypothetical protein
MKRLSPFVPALAIVALLLAAAPGVAAAAQAGEEPAEIYFSLPANNGLHAHLETFNGKVTLEIQRKGRLVSYEVAGRRTEAGLKVRFGQLGSIDVAFEPTKTTLEGPPKGCQGPPSKLSEGFFVGTIEFTGEREYVRIEASRVKGHLNVWKEGEWRCPNHSGPLHRGAARPKPLATVPAERAKPEVATLFAVNQRRHRFFAAYAVRGRSGRGMTAFVGAETEEREKMEIGRSTFTKAAPSAFVFNHAAGTATVRPPQPFSGHGTFKRRPHARDLWRSTIQVPLLGADPLRVGGPGFRAGLLARLPEDE